MSRTSLFKSIENKDDVYRVKECMKRFCESLRENTLELTNFEKIKILLLTSEQQESHENAKSCYICKEKI